MNLINAAQIMHIKYSKCCVYLRQVAVLSLSGHCPATSKQSGRGMHADSGVNIATVVAVCTYSQCSVVVHDRS